MLTIKHIRKKRQITLDELAEKTGISKRMICTYEKNEADIPYLKLKRIAKVLNVNIHELDSESQFTSNGNFSLDNIPINLELYTPNNLEYINFLRQNIAMIENTFKYNEECIIHLKNIETSIEILGKRLQKLEIKTK